MDDLALFLSTVNPDGIERELLGDYEAARRESFAAPEHKSMVAAHDYMRGEFYRVMVWKSSEEHAIEEAVNEEILRRKLAVANSPLEQQIRAYKRKKAS